MALLAACGGGGDDTPPAPETELSFLDSTNFEKVLSAVPAEAASVAMPASTTTLTVHYKRKDGVYTGWQLHTWGAAADPGWNKGYNATGTDAFGAIYTPTLASSSGDVGYLFHNGDTKDHGGADQKYSLQAGANEIWRIEGDGVTYTKNPDTAGPVDVSTIRVHYKRFDSKFDVWGLHLWDSNGMDVTKMPAGYAAPTWGTAITLDKMPGYAVVSPAEVVFDIPVINPTTDNTKKSLEFIIHGTAANPNGGADNKDGRNDNIVVNYANLTPKAKVAEIWLVQDDATVYTTVPDTRSASTKDAKAYWLTKSLIKWPRVDGTGVFKLYYSKNGQIVAAKDAAVKGADGALTLDVGGTVPADVATRFKYVAAGVVLSVKTSDADKLPGLLTNQLVVVQEDASGKVQNATTAQIAGALDDLYAAAKDAKDLGVTIAGGNTTFKVWAPTAQQVKLGLYDTATSKGASLEAMTFDASTGIWSLTKSGDLSGKYYVYVADVFVRGAGVIRNRVTDPYSISLNADSKRSYIADLSAANLKPTGWDSASAPALTAQEDMSIYELSVRDFSANDSSVSAANRGKYLAFTEDSNGMKHLKALQQAGLTDVHLLPVFDLATIPEVGCVAPNIGSSTADSTAARDAINAVKDKDCFNWGYDPFHYTSAEGSYSSDANDGAKRIVEFRQMVAALHAAGLRVGMDVVYNHTSAAGRDGKAVLDRIVPGYYQRLNATGGVENSTCCSNTATENLMMGKLMIDSVKTWATQYKIDSFRFDLMGHQPRATMEQLKTTVNAAAGRDVFLIGEGWNFGEVASGARFEQASQLSLNGSGIATFSDRARDRIRGGGCCDDGDSFRAQGYVTGLWYDNSDYTGAQTASQKESLMDHADVIRVGLSGSLRSFSFEARDGSTKTGADIKYGNDPAGYVTDPQEVVNYYENHDNRTFWDATVAKLPKGTSLDDRVRVQTLAAAINSFSQGIAYFHAGSDILRSKSMDNNSYNSGDWFNRLFWDYSTNNFGVGLPVSGDQNLAKAFLAAATLANYTPTTTQITASRDMFKDLLAIRKSSQLFRLRTADDVKKCLKFYNTGAAQEPTVLVGHLDGSVCTENANFKQVMYFINVDKVAHDITIAAESGASYELHPVHKAASAADKRAATATYDNASGKFSIPARTAVVFVSASAPKPVGPVPVAAGSVRVHFQQTGATYADWGVYSWSGPVTVDTAWPGGRKKFVNTDSFGGYVDIPVDASKGKMDFLVIDGTGTKACGTDQAITFAADVATKGQEAWVVGCSVTDGPPIAAGSLRVHFQQTGATYADWGVYSWSGPVTVDTAWPGGRMKFVNTDSFGGYVDIPVDATKGKMDFLVIDGAGTKACGTDQAITFAADIATKGQQAWVVACTVTATKP
ncbi:alpha-1,6-glucosidase domain-containing protein [Niveibacterium umoris]|uniref:alpha-1,6-glucosidase domain-containing protein n=1 Tax=Niveibacterium umoris TaxID=1193620 RepID=UPI001615511C|nr:alpha-1,6-glucosidase domain-containing protein [Niveibacterium umoris]